MHRLPGRVRFAPYRDDLAQTAPCQSQTHRSVAKNYSKTHSRWVNQPVDVPANSINRYSPHHAFSIGTAKPTRLPPWEDFQRGPQSAHAEILHPDPHRKSFTKPDDPPNADVIPLTLREPCPDCGGPMRIIETFHRGQKPQPVHHQGDGMPVTPP